DQRSAHQRGQAGVEHPHAHSRVVRLSRGASEMKDPITLPLCLMLSACGAQTTSDRDVSEVGANERRAPVHVSLARKESELSEPNTVNRIELRYRDASTPPRYHRSYTIVVTPEGVDASVDVYGKVIATARHALTNERWV